MKTTDEEVAEIKVRNNFERWLNTAKREHWTHLCVSVVKLTWYKRRRKIYERIQQRQKRSV